MKIIKIPRHYSNPMGMCNKDVGILKKLNEPVFSNCLKTQQCRYSPLHTNSSQISLTSLWNGSLAFATCNSESLKVLANCCVGLVSSVPALCMQ